MPLSIVQKTKSMFPSLTGGYIKNTSSEPSSSKEDLGGLKDGSDDDNDDDDSGDTDDEDEDEDEDEDVMEWENVFHDTIEPTSSTSALSSSKEMGDLQLTLQNNRAGSLTGQNKRGASAQQRRIRMVTHCLHVQFLLFYGATRNGWICDLELHAILLSHLNPSIMRDVEKYQARQSKKSNKQAVTKKAVDPLLKLLGALIHWWKKKYIVDKPGMRKHGYKTLSQFQEEQQAEDKFQFTTGSTGKDGQETYTSFKNQGERVRGLEGFKKLATECKGSRDTGAILFTALLRAIGLEARMVFSLQPLGFGFTERENFREVGSTKEEEIDKAQRKEAATGNRKGKSKVEEAITSDDDTGNERENFAFEESTLDVFRKPQKLAHDTDLKYPIFWSEVYSSTAGKWITVESLVYTVLGSSPDLLAKFEPKGKKAVDSKQVIAYVVSYSPDGTAKDITVRYLHKNIFPGKTKGFRIPTTKIPVYDYEGKVVGINNRDWFGTVLRGYRTPEHLRTDREQGEDNELQKLISKSKEAKGRQKESITFYKNNPYYVLERHLKREEAVKPGKIHLKIFTVGKGDKVKDEKVYSKEDIAVCKTVENWYREGRVIKEGQQPLKIVKPRAATLNRKREIEEAKRDGEIIMQGLYSEDQTKPYSPPPIVDGRIPRNSFGNIDIYVPSMIPLGAIHLSLIGSANVAKRLGIDYAEAVTGFEFKKQRAVPLVQGVIIATENEGLLRDAWRAEKEEKKKRADEKREKAALTMWWRFLKGLRIVRRLSRMYEDVEYGEVESNPFTARKSYTVCEKNLSQGELDNKSKEGGRFPSEREQNYEMSGGFIGGDRNEAYGADDFSNGEEAIATGSDFGEDEPPRDTDLLIASANSHNNLMSLSGMVSQREIQPSEGSAKPGSEKETQWPTTSPEVRSYLMNIASNDVREGVGEGKAPAISPNGKNRASEVPGEVEPKPCAKVTIEVQIPIPKALPGQNIRGSKINRVSALDSAPNIRPTSGGTRRTPKRKATAEVGRKPNKYLKNDGSSSSDGGEVGANKL